VICAVAGGKGGVGKTTVALNLGYELDAVVVDADLGMADVPAGRGPDLHDVLAGRAAPVEAVREGGPVDVLPCGRSLVGARTAEVTALVAAVNRVERAYGDVVVDCPAGMAADVGIPLFAAGRCVLVTVPGAAVADVLDIEGLSAVETSAVAEQSDAGGAGEDVDVDVEGGDFDEGA
jgi:septum site-determining protein MinD